MAVIDKAYQFQSAPGRTRVDVVVVSHNPPLNIISLMNAFEINQIIFDGSNLQRKVNKWKAECEKLGLAYHSVVEKGAFVMKVD